MKYKIQKIIFIALVFLCSGETKMIAQNIARNNGLHQLFENYYEDRLKYFPLEATAVGDNRYNNILPNDGSQVFLKQVHDFYSQYQKELNNFQPESLNSEDRISFYILKDILNRELDGEKFHKERMPFAQVFSLPLKMGQFGSGTGDQPFKTVKDYDDWLQRIEAFAIWTDTTIANFRKGIEAGMVLPKALVLKMIPQMEKLAQLDTSKNIFYGPIKHYPELFSEQDKVRLTAAYNHAIEEQLIPCYQKLHDFFSGEYLNAARSTSGINALPNGDAMYRYYIYYFTTTHQSPEKIYQTGLDEVKRITAEMENLKNQMGFRGTLKELFNFMQTDKQFRASLKTKC